MSKKKKQKDTYICEYCGNKHDGSYGSGRFCSASCARQYANQYVTAKGRENQIKALINPTNRQKSTESFNKNYKEKVKRGDIIPYQKSRLKSLTPESKYKPRNGKLGEIATIKKFAEHDIPVYLPVSDNGIDMVAEFGGKMQKIQVKSTTVSNDKFATFSLTHNKNIIKEKTVTTEHRKYSSDKVDYFSLYDIPNDEVFLLKNNRDIGSINIRYKKSKNNQSLKVNNAEDYQIDKVLDEIELGIDPDNIIDADYEILDDE